MQEPTPTTDEEEHAAKERAIAVAITSLEAGEGVPHEMVRKWLSDLANGIRKPIPRAPKDDPASKAT